MAELVELIEDLTDEQERRCAYGTREGDGRTCDCKWGLSVVRMPAGERLGIRMASELTGCPELRAAIIVLRGTL